MTNTYMMEVFAWLLFFVFTISVMVALLLPYLKRQALKEEQEAVDSNAKQITDYFGELLFSERFLWTVWQGQAEFAEMRIFVRDELDNQITTIHCPTLLKQGNIRRWFDLDGEQYQQVKDSMTSVKMRYRRLGSSTTLYMSEWKFGKLYIYKGDGDILLLTVKSGTVFSKYSSVEQSGHQIARIINSNKVAGYSKVLTSKSGSLTKLEQLIILTAF